MIFLGLAVYAQLASAQTAPEPELSFAAVLAQGLERSLEAKRAVLAVQLAADDRRIADYDNDPHLNLGGNWSDYRPRSGTPPVGAGGFQRDQVYTAQVAATLYDFGRHSSRLAQADALTGVKELAQGEVSEAFLYRLARAYAGVLAAERLALVNTDQVAVEAEQLRDQEANYRRGLRPESDVVQAQVALGKAKLALLTAQDQIRLSRLALGLLIGEERQPLLTAPVPKAGLDILSGTRWDQAVVAWREFRPSAAQLRRAAESKALAADEALVDAVKRPLLQGTVAATSSGGWNSSLRNLYTGQVGLAWDLPWTGLARDERRRIGTRRQDLEVQDQIDRKVRLDLDQQAQEQLRAGKTQVAALSSQLRLIEREKLLVKRRYDAGKAAAFELQAAEADRLTQRLALITLLNTLQLRVIDIAEARAVPATALEGIFR